MNIKWICSKYKLPPVKNSNILIYYIYESEADTTIIKDSYKNYDILCSLAIVSKDHPDSYIIIADGVYIPENEMIIPDNYYYKDIKRFFGVFYWSYLTKNKHNKLFNKKEKIYYDKDIEEKLNICAKIRFSLI